MAPQKTRVSPLDEALSLLASSTVTERNKGIELISDLLTNPSNLSSIKESRWAEIFHQLFSTADTEKSAIFKTSKSAKASSAKTANLNRLRTTLGLIRKCVVQFVSHFKQKVMKLVLNRTMELIVSPSRFLMDDIVLDCIRILRDFLSYRPHLEHLDNDLSAEMLAICFASILDRKMPEDHMIPGNESFRPEPPLDGKKLANGSQAASPRIIDSAQLLSIVLPASTSVCLQSSKCLLSHFRLVLQKFPRDTSAHFHLISALHLLLRELELNKGGHVRQSAIDLGNCLTTLWPSKNMALKEQITACLTYLLPFIVREAEIDRKNPESEKPLNAEDLAKKVLHMISDDAELQAKSSTISLGTLRLIVPPQGLDLFFFGTKAFSRTHCDGVDSASERAQVITWAALRIGASALNCAARLTHQPPAREAESPSKRRKVDSELDSFLSAMQPGSPSASIVHLIQFLIVTVDLHWSDLDFQSRMKIKQSVLEFLDCDDPAVLNWAFIFFGSLAHCIAPPCNPSSSQQEAHLSKSVVPSIKDWEHIWSLAIHRAANPSYSRSACYAAFCILKARHIPTEATHEAIHSFLRTLNVQGPPFPYDSVCVLISECLAFASGNLQLSAYSLEENVLRWLTKVWLEVDRSAATSSLLGGHLQRGRRLAPGGFDAAAVFELLISITKLPAISLPTPMAVPPEGVTTDTFVYLKATQSTRSSIFPRPQQQLSENNVKNPSQSNDIYALSHERPSRSDSKHEISAMLRQSVEKLYQEFEFRQKKVEQVLAVVSCDHLQMFIKMSLVVLLFQASCQASEGSFDLESVDVLADVFEVILQLVGSPKWSPSERAQLLTCFEPIILPLVNRCPTSSFDGLAQPGLASGIPLKQRAKLELESFNLNSAPLMSRASSNPDYKAVALGIWSFSPVMRLQLEALSKMCERLLQSIPTLTPSAASGNATEAHPAHTQSGGTTINFEEEEEDIVAEETPQTHEGSATYNSESSIKRKFRTDLGSIGTERATFAVTSICVRAAATCVVTSSDSSHCPLSVFAKMTDCVGLEVIYMGIPLVDCITGGWITLTATQSDQLLQHLGETYLSTYAYSQNISLRKLSLKMVMATIPHWTGSSEGITEDVETTAHQLCDYMTSQMLQGTLRSWEVQCELSYLLDACTAFHKSWDSSVVSKGQDVTSNQPSDLMLWFLEDEDYRVRYGAALFVSRPFVLGHSIDLDPVEYWRQVVQRLDPCVASVQLELLFTATLCLINIFVVSEQIRPRAYDKLLKILRDPPARPDKILHYELGYGLLRRASCRLGFPSTIAVYKFYAAHVTRVQLGQQDSPSICSHYCVGHLLTRQQRKELFNGHLLEVGPFLYIDDKDSFKQCADGAKLKEEDAVRLCSPAIAAELLARACTQIASAECTTDGIAELIEPMLNLIAQDLKLEQGILETESDRVIVHLMRLVHVASEDMDSISKIVTQDSAQRNVFRVLTVNLRAHSPLEPALPFYPILRVAEGMKWLGDRYSLFTEPALVYNILCQSFASLTSCYFTNDRLRLLYAISIYISLSHQTISSSLPILSLIIQALTPLILNDDIFQSVSQFIRWTIMKALQPLNVELKGHASMAQLFISIVELMNQVVDSTSSTPEDILFARAFNAWLLEHVAKTSKSDRSECQILCNSLLLHWPENHPIEIQGGVIESVLGSSPGPTFKLIHHLHNNVLPGSKTEAGNILYRLLASAQNLRTEIKVEDCQSYLKLLYRNSGVLTSPRLGDSHRGESKAALEEEGSESEDHIVSQILAIVVSHLLTPDFQLLCSLTDLLQRASSLEILPEFENNCSSLAPLLIERSQLICYKTDSLKCPVLTSCKTTHPQDFCSLDGLACSSHHWTRGLLHLLIASRAQARPFYAQLIPLIEMNDDLAAQFLPRVLHSCLLDEINSTDTQTNLRTKVSKHIGTTLASYSTHKDVVIRILDLVTDLRFHSRPGGSPLGNNQWLDVSWLELAKQATKCGMASSAFLFVEIAREEGFSIDISKPLDGAILSLLERLYSISPEPDAFYSLIPSNPTNFLLQRYQHEQQWESAFGFHGALLERFSSKSPALSEDMPLLAGYLSGNGLNRLAHVIFQSRTLSQAFGQTPTTETENSPTLPFELAWRASVWDLPSGNQSDTDSSTRIYSSLKSCYRDREKNAQINVAEKSLLGQFKELVNITATSVQPTPRDIGSAMALSDVFNWLKNPQQDDFESLILLPPDCQYETLERISAVRRSLLQAVSERKKAEGYQDRGCMAAQEAELKLRIKTSQAARHSGNVQAAVNIIVPFSNLTNKETGDTVLQAKEEFAQVLWAKGEKSLALNIMKEVQGVQTKLPESAVQLCQIGEWISLARLKPPMEIVDQYFEKAIQLLEDSNYTDAQGEISYTYAKFADEQYHKLDTSEEMRRLKKSTKRLKEEIKGTAKLAKADIGARRAMVMKEKLFRDDSYRLDSLSKLETRYLSSSLDMYLSCLSHYDQRDEVIFRFVSLWLEHHSDEALNEGISTRLKSVPTHKFIPVANQLSARLNKESQSNFQKSLVHLILQLSLDHPFHIIFQILLLQRGLESSCLNSLSNSRSRRTSNITAPRTLSQSDLSRAEAANSVLSKIAQNKDRKEVIKELLLAHKAYKEWASHGVKDGQEKAKPNTRAQIPSNFSLNSLRNLSIPVSTSRVPIDKTRLYLPDSMPCISNYETKFTVASGLSAPKITICRGSNGISYKQIFKGGDDVRQDAVMEQVFELVNNFLEGDPECQKRSLNFKTYIVIPLSPNTGLIEFVKNTSSLLDILEPMHKKYNEPPDWDFRRLSRHLTIDIKAEIRLRIKLYREAITHCRPAMRFWFLQTQKSPQKWYEMRLNFTRSAATTSIVGYILGLGDRHLSNILVDRVTGDVVQIDLGVAFDGGKALPIPETVPFRLSRDMVDGFGVAKTEGVFRRCCEQTLRVLKENKWLIMTIIDVLKHDPLQSWIVSKEEEKIKQGARENLEDSGSEDLESLDQSLIDTPEQASRALASVEMKLSSNLSVETNVNQLILEATSVDNLGSLFSAAQFMRHSTL
ncbi:hypothetical protein PCANC_06966 [Puccinia coronata f. sp. avenae]|uniref:Serine/threonine-protein kinase TEL1 n=1 Tax=Puccinia coronata f. sp. avenae TaxID=200324 RepID=A0A2N5VKT7_9BASI|nr:hypothetical protein PCANC_06966 [Puccinia coronata f. sp. avenae]